MVNKGYKQTEEHKRRIGIANAIKLKGRKLSEETKKKMRKSHLGKIHSGTFKKGHKINIGGNKGSFKKGFKPWNYIDGRSKLSSPARYGDDWDKIRYLIYLRDKFMCQDCGVSGVRLDVHHKIPFLVSFDNSLNNLISLCRSCHRQEEAKIMSKLKLEVNSIARM